MKKKVALLIIVIFIIGLGIYKISFSENKKFQEVLSTIDGSANIDTYTIYGRFFNLSGFLDYEKELTLVLKKDKEEINYPLITEIQNGKTIFKTNELINEGINLEKIEVGNYIFLLKDTEGKYYSLKNSTSYKELEYYTITKSNNNKKIKIDFSELNKTDYLNVTVKNEKLANNIYDIVIDPGHGGVDVGANKNGYYESNLNLEYAKKIANELETLGLKVKLTREDDTFIPTYGTNGRVSIPYQTKAKLMLSIHMNSAVQNVGNGGVEIYVPNFADISFAQDLSKNIVEYTSSPYSQNKSNKVYDGVYLRTLSESDLENMRETALEKGYEPYDLATTDSTYYYIIRETGGIITGSYVDSRNEEKEWNKDYLSNHGCESYLVELGYMNSSSNLNILLNETDNYVKAIVESVKEYLEI